VKIRLIRVIRVLKKSLHLCRIMKTIPHNSWLIILLILLVSGNMLAQLPERIRLPIQISKELNDTARINLMVRYVMRCAPGPEQKRLYNEIYVLSLRNNYKPGLIFHRYYEVSILIDSGRYDEAIAKDKSCIDGLDSLGVLQYCWYPLYNIRFIYFAAGKQIEMFRYYTDKVAYYKRHGPIGNTAACYHGLGRYYLSMAYYDKAIGYFMRAFDVYRSFDPLGAVNEKGIIGSTYMEWGNLGKAEEYYKSAFKDIIRLNEVYNSSFYDAFGDICFERHDYKRALQYYFEGRKYYNLPHFRASNLVKIASVHLQLGCYDSALYYLVSAETIQQKEKSGIIFRSNFIDIDFYFYKYYAATGNGKLALKYLEAALLEAQSSKNVSLRLKYTNELHSYLLKKGDSLQALRYLVQYHTIQDSLNTMNTKARIASFEIEQRSQEKEDEIEQLQLQKTTQRNYYLIGGALLLLLVIGVIISIIYKRRRDKEQLTMDFKKQLAQAETKALRAQMNPHFIFNSLNSINSFVMDQKHEIASDYLIKFSKLIRLILDNSRSETISIEKELETLKLYVVLEAARFDNKFKCVYHIAEDVETNSIMIPPMLLQPFVENAIWHGLMQKEGPGTIRIEIAMKNEEFLNISIEDDGIGREKAAELKSKSATHKSHGLKVTSQRIEMMNKLNSTGAKVNIVDLKDEQGNATGTRVELIIPF
jgi:tetratricopeptide (TPR) repeat protein